MLECKTVLDVASRGTCPAGCCDKQGILQGYDARVPHRVQHNTAVAREAFAERGWKLAADFEFLGARVKIPFTCENGHSEEIFWGPFMRGGGCEECRQQNRKENTGNEVRAFLENEGWMIAKDWEYIDCFRKIPLACRNGHRAEKSWTVIQQNPHCVKCGEEAKIERRERRKAKTRQKRTEQARNAFKKEGLDIAEDWIYQRSTNSIPFTCEKGHQSDISWRDFQKGDRCRECKKELKLKKRAVEVRAAFAEQGLIIAEDWIYEGCAKKIQFTCEKGHNDSILLSNFKEIRGCSECKRQARHKERLEKRKAKTEEICQEFSQRGWTVQEDWIYQKSRKKIPFTCENGHKHKMTLQNLRTGTNCTHCVKAEKRTTCLGVAMTKLQRQKLRDISAQEGRTMAAIIRETIDNMPQPSPPSSSSS